MRVKKAEVHTMKDTHETRIALLEQTTQYIFQTLERIEKRLDSIEEKFDNKLDAMNTRMDGMHARIDANTKWLVGTMFATGLSLIGIVTNLVLHFHS